MDEAIRAAYAATQSLQGPLDGVWRLRDARGQVRLFVYLSDPPGGTGPLSGAWRIPAGASGLLLAAERSGPRLRLVVQGGDTAGTVELHADRGRWRGRWVASGKAVKITLSR